MVCSKCGHEINHEQFPLGLTFCPYCGDRVSGHDPSQALSFCPYCGRRLLIAATFCPECGKRVTPGTSSPSHYSGTMVPAFPETPSHHVLTSRSAEAPFSGAPPPPERHQYFPETPVSAAPYSNQQPPPRTSYQQEVDEEFLVIEEPPTPSRSSQPIWPKIAAVCKRAYEPVESLITGRWRLKRLYQDWSVHDALPPEEIPNDDHLKNMPRQAPLPAQQIPTWVIIAAIVAAVLLFVAIGVIIRQVFN